MLHCEWSWAPLLLFAFCSEIQIFSCRLVFSPHTLHSATGAFKHINNSTSSRSIAFPSKCHSCMQYFSSLKMFFHWDFMCGGESKKPFKVLFVCIVEMALTMFMLAFIRGRNASISGLCIRFDLAKVETNAMHVSGDYLTSLAALYILVVLSAINPYSKVTPNVFWPCLRCSAEE